MMGSAGTKRRISWSCFNPQSKIVGDQSERLFLSQMAPFLAWTLTAEVVVDKMSDREKQPFTAREASQPPTPTNKGRGLTNQAEGSPGHDPMMGSAGTKRRMSGSCFNPQSKIVGGQSKGFLATNGTHCCLCLHSRSGC